MRGLSACCISASRPIAAESCGNARAGARWARIETLSRIGQQRWRRDAPRARPFSPIRVFARISRRPSRIIARAVHCFVFSASPRPADSCHRVCAWRTRPVVPRDIFGTPIYTQPSLPPILPARVRVRGHTSGNAAGERTHRASEMRARVVSDYSGKRSVRAIARERVQLGRITLRGEGGGGTAIAERSANNPLGASRSHAR